MVIGRLTEIRYNPADNLIRFAFFISFPALLLAALYLMDIAGLRKYVFSSAGALHAGTMEQGHVPVPVMFLSRLAVILAVVLAINSATYHSWGKFDAFHEGESLGTAVSYEAGETPYRDFLFAHGIFQDPLRSVIAFNIFGKSIGAARALESLMKILAFLLMTLFFLKVFRGLEIRVQVILILFGLLFTAIRIGDGEPAAILMPREITTFSFLLSAACLHEFIRRNETGAVKLFTLNLLFSFIPLASFLYSIDRGFYLTAAFVVIAPVVYFSFFHKSVLRRIFITSCLAGILSALLLLLWLMQGGFAEFLKFSFSIMPKYKELMDGAVYQVRKPEFLTSCLLVSVDVFWCITAFLSELHNNGSNFFGTVKNFTGKYLTELCLLLLSVFFFRSALGRADWEHVSYSIIPALSLFFIIVLKHIFAGPAWDFLKSRIFARIVITLSVICALWGVFRMAKKDLLVENFPLTRTDAELVPDNYKAAAAFLKKNLAADEDFLTLTSEASWYYLVNKPCPVRFGVVWFAAPVFYQEEIVGAMKEKKIKYIIYGNSSWSNRIDGISNKTRMPVLYDYIEANYSFFARIQDIEIWKKNGY